MSHSFISSHYHIVFSTKNRMPLLTKPIRDRLFPYVNGIAHPHRIQVYALGGIENHIHLLASLPAQMSLAKAVQLIKGSASKWINETFSDSPFFAWQQGYAAFSIGVSQRRRTVEYIANQKHNHKTKTYEQELKIFLERHGYKFTAQCLE